MTGASAAVTPGGGSGGAHAGKEGLDDGAQFVGLLRQRLRGAEHLARGGAGFARRWRESAFVPIVTPSLVQLRAELQRQAEAKA